MESLQQKLFVLEKIAHELNQRKITWALGASALLYFKNITDHFNDLDIMVVEEDLSKIEDFLQQNFKGKDDSHLTQFRTKHFFEGCMDGVDIDLMIGFVIEKDGVLYDCSLKKEQIVEYIDLNNERIPLQSILDWRKYYELMNRKNKVEMIDVYLKENGGVSHVL